MIAITGANGFIGSYIRDQLPYPQKRLTRQPIFKSFSSEKCQWIQGNLQEIHAIKELIYQSSTLIHLACTSNPRSSNQNFIDDIEQNLISSLRLFETFASSNSEGHIIFTSSGGNMYEANLPHIMRSENDLPAPRSSYAIHKLALEHYLRQLCETYKIRSTILRISNPYGILLPTKRAQGLIGVAFSKLLAGEELPIFDSLESVRDYIHLEDILKAFQLSIQFPPRLGECRLFNVSSNVGFTNKAVLDLIDETTQMKIKRHYVQKELPSPTCSILSYEKIHHVLGWKPTIHLKEGINKIWKNILQSQSIPSH